MKFERAPEVAAAGVAEADRSTRERVCREVLGRGPVTATELATILGLTPAAVRRHLDGLLAEGLVTTWESGDTGRRGRGRPARRFVLTDAGHSAMATDYDDLATAALQFLAEVAGEDAVRQFATTRAGHLAARYRPAVEAAGTDPQRRAEALAQVLTTDGYAATSRPLAGTSVHVTGKVPGKATAGKVAAAEDVAGTQLCQGHCPVQHVAERFPQLCEAETEAFSALLGVHVQRLATLAHGAHVCTTHVPGRAHTGPIPAITPDEESTRR